jgi:hypothetical protein
VSYDELRKGLTEMGVTLTETEFALVADRFDTDRAGEIDYDHFADVVSGDNPVLTAGKRYPKKVSDTYRSSVGEAVGTSPQLAAAAAPAEEGSPKRRASMAPTLSDVTAKPLLQRLRSRVGGRQDEVREPRSRVARVADGSAGQVSRAFADADPHQTGVLSAERFASVVRSLDATVGQDEIEVRCTFVSIPRCADVDLACGRRWPRHAAR